MKKLITLALAFVLTGCGALAPAATPTAVPPTSTPVVLVQTVMVTVIPTQAPTEVPTQTPAPTQTPQIIVVTATGAPATAAPAVNSANPTAAVAQATGAATATLPANAGGQYFTNLTRNGDVFYLRCQPDTITFGVSTSNPYISEVDLFYRIEDRLSTSITDWKNGGKMVSDKNGNFTLAFTSATVAPDFRSHKAWFDYEFVGINKFGDRVGGTAKIVQQITYKIDCTD